MALPRTRPSEAPQLGTIFLERRKKIILLLVVVSILNFLLWRPSFSEVGAKKYDWDKIQLKPCDDELEEGVDNKKKVIFHLVLLYSSMPKPGFFCTLESLVASLERSQNENAEIWVWVSSVDHVPTDYSKHAQIVPKVLKFDDVISCTPLEVLYNSNKFLGLFADFNKVNALRLALMYKYGGYYMDNDFIVVSDPSALGHGAAMEDIYKWNGAALFFEKNSPLLEWMMRNFVENYKGSAWGNQGPKLVTRMVDMCNATSNYSAPPFEGDVTCGNYGVLHRWPTKALYAVPWQEAKRVAGEDFSSSAKSLNLVSGEPFTLDSDVLMIHTYHHKTSDIENKLCRQRKSLYLSSFFGGLRHHYCPASTKKSIEAGCQF